jgi:prepilin-type N-terminal cleavage/methylation domain-containing protein
MRKGFTLVEVLVVIIVLPFVFLIIDGLFRTLLSDLPWSYRIAQENTTMLNVLEHLQRDIGQAKGLPESFAGHTVSDDLLLIELADGVICYQLKDGQVVRSKLTETQQESAEEKRIWSMPHAEIVWRVRTKNGEGYAVDTKAHIEHRVRGQWKNKMARSHLYFVGAF